MSLNELKGKSIYDLTWEEFEKLFCPQCKDAGICSKDPKTVNMCMGLIDSGIWDVAFRLRMG